MKKIIIALFLVISAGFSFAQQNEWDGVEKVFGKKGTLKDGVFKIMLPRSDLKIVVDDFAVAPSLCLTTWIGFMKMDGKTMMMGDIVMLDKEVAGVVAKIASENLKITALHNHILGESPAIKYTHFSGEGDAVKLAEKIKKVIATTATPFGVAQAGETSTPDWTKVENILGTSGKKVGKVLQYSFAREEKLTDDGIELPPFMGVATTMNFQTEGDKTAIAGDYILMAEEVNVVIKTLTEQGIKVVAVHNHMLYDNPRLFMVHFWAVGTEPEKLAAGLKSALDKTKIKITRK